jgi:hypothetical protein
MRSSLVLAAIFLALFGLTAQTPAPSQTPEKPLRHLEYSFAVHEGGVRESHFNGIGLVPSAGVGGGASNEGGSGTMYVDVLSVASDGALRVQISEYVQNEPRSGQAYTCTVYGNTTVLCPSAPAPSAAEWVLLSYLGREFVDAAPWDAKHQWQRKQDTDQYTLVENFTMSNAGSDPKLVLIRETKKMELHNGGFGTRNDEVEINYDRSMELPDSVHDDMQMIGQAGSEHASFDFHLTSDSFAKASKG